MPLDFTVTQPPRHEDWGLNKVINWQLRFCLLPKECFLTGRRLWFTKAYHGIRMITGPGEPVFDHYWVGKDEFIIWKLQGHYDHNI